MSFKEMTMAKIFRCSVLFCLIAVYSIYVKAQGYEIKIKMPALKDSTVILGHHFANGTGLYPDDTIHLDQKGTGTFKKTKALTGGMYFIFFEKKKYFDIFLSANQKFTVEADTGNFLKTVKFTGSPENQMFYDYQNYLADKRAEVDKLNEKRKNATGAQKDSINKTIDKVSHDVTAYGAKIINANPSFTLSAFLKSLQELEVPDPPKVNGVITDSMFQARYYKTHYFDNLDLNDNRLLRTPTYEQKVIFYIDKVVHPMPDSLSKEADMLLEKVRNNPEVFRFMLITLFNHYASSQVMGQDAVLVHIAEKWYIPYATWSTKDFTDKLKKEVAKKKPNLIGNLAPNLKLIEITNDHFMAAKADTALKSNPYVGNPFNLRDIKARFLIVAFWEADCGHCKKEIPALYDTIYPQIKDKDVKVLAIHSISSVEGKRKWIDFVNEHRLYNWINAWSPYSADYKDLYDVYATPMIYVLDENKKIIAKHVSPQQAQEIINFEIKKAENKK
jgi:hypothetical protein